MDLGIRNLFEGIEDPRVDRTKKHPLDSILYIVLCGTISGCESWTDYEDYAYSHYEELKQIINLPNGVPSHDTIARVISSLNVNQFKACFQSFIHTLVHASKGVISIDGKTIRGSFDHEKEIKARHIVSAWAHGLRLVLGQEKVDDHSNEITAIPQLLNQIELSDQIVTIDAMGCQRTICQQILDQEGDYVISLKGNQGTLHEDVRRWFEDPNTVCDHIWEEWDKGHGRIEHRLCQSAGHIQWLRDRHNWPGLCSIAAVYSTRETKKGTASDVRYYISSLPANAETIAQAARYHWGIENSLHWVLDVTFNEDKSRIRIDNAPEILSIMRQWGINLINQHKGKLSIRRMTRKIAMSPSILIQILQKI